MRILTQKFLISLLTLTCLDTTFDASTAFARKIQKKTSSKKHTEQTKDTDQLSDTDAIAVYPGATSVPVLAKQALVMDMRTKTILLNKNGDMRMTPSSMSKMMTSYIVEEKIMKGEITPETLLPVSRKAWSTGGSKTFVPLNGDVRVIDMLRGAIIQSGNDACIVLAEGIAGSEEAFAHMMNEKARAMGLTGTQFMNASGLPQDGHYSTAKDLAILGARIIEDHPQFYPLYGEKEFTFGKDNRGRPITQGNRNPLLHTGNTGCDGIKTGHTDDGGHGIVASFVDSGQRYIMVINGLKTKQARADEARKLLAWAKQNFINKRVYKKGDVIDPIAPVWLGVKASIPLILADDVDFLTLRSKMGTPKVTLHFESPIPAPIQKGDVIGKITIHLGDQARDVSVLAGDSCEKVGFFMRIMHSISYLLWGQKDHAPKEPSS